MAYYPDNWTDKELEALEKRIAEVFKEAEKDLDKEVKDYFAKFKLRDKQMQELVEAGEMSKDDYQQWRLTQMGRGQRFEALRDKVAERYTQANEVANAYVNDMTPSIYSLNRNYEAYTIEKTVGSCDFTMWDESTVRRLLVEQPDLMPYYPPSRALNRGIDLAYGKDQITKHVTSGIIRGLAPGKIANELMTGITTMNRDSAVRAARTGITAAQNAGRLDSYIAAENMGIQIKRRWMCTKDARTRLSHGMADGQIVVGTKKPFIVGGYKMMFPGDKSLNAPGHEIYNCRCTTRTVEKDGIEAEPRQMRVKNAEGEWELVNEMTYSEWVKWKETGKKPEPQIPTTPKKTSAMRRDPAKFRQRATESATSVETPEEYSKRVADKHGISIDISEAGKLTEEAKEQVAAIDKLLDEYNSTMVDYRLVKGGFYDKDGGQCYMLDGKSAVSVKTSTIKRNSSQDRLNLGDNSHLMTTYHEFAHSLSQSRENNDHDFWKDVKKVRTNYRKELKGIDKAERVDHTMNIAEATAAKKKIFISDYAEKDIDEFLADAFAQAKLSSNPSPYAEEVLKTVDKYFKKPLESSSKRSIIKVKNSELANGLPIKGTANSTVDKTDDDGNTLQRRIYGDDGMAKVDFDTSDHGLPKAHPNGAHKHTFDFTKKRPRGNPLPLTEEELAENEDIIQKGANYHD